MAETNTTLQSNYTPIKKNNKWKNKIIEMGKRRRVYQKPREENISSSVRRQVRLLVS